jgi:hypothetical protein
MMQLLLPWQSSLETSATPSATSSVYTQ